jgi:hypothetical protein
MGPEAMDSHLKNYEIPEICKWKKLHGKDQWNVTVESIANLYSRAPKARYRTAQGGAQRNPGLER